MEATGRFADRRGLCYIRGLMMTALRHRWLIVGLGLAMLSACAGGQQSSGVSSGLVRGYSFGVAGKSYTVHRISRRRNLFSISTDDGGPGDRAAMRRVVRLAFGCHSLELTQTAANWQAAEARGAVCTGGYQRYNHNR